MMRRMGFAVALGVWMAGAAVAQPGTLLGVASGIDDAADQSTLVPVPRQLPVLARASWPAVVRVKVRLSVQSRDTRGSVFLWHPLYTPEEAFNSVFTKEERVLARLLMAVRERLPKIGGSTGNYRPESGRFAAWVSERYVVEQDFGWSIGDVNSEAEASELAARITHATEHSEYSSGLLQAYSRTITLIGIGPAPATN